MFTGSMVAIATPMNEDGSIDFLSYEKEKGQAKEDVWNTKFETYSKEFPELASELKRRMGNELPANWKKLSEKLIKDADANGEKMATRKASQNAIQL